MEEDIRLIEKYLSGDSSAIEALVMKYQKPIYAYVYRMAGNVEDAKDLTQKTFLQVFKGLKDFRGEASFKTWLYKIATNAALNHIRQTRFEETELEESIPGDGRGNLAIVIEKEKLGSINESLRELPERQRLAVILRAYDGLSCLETAKVMGCSEGAVKANYHNGVRRLREILKEKGYETIS
jgi:RNA polymerase sigma-70 factor, ECF subfamily